MAHIAIIGYSAIQVSQRVLLSYSNKACSGNSSKIGFSFELQGLSMLNAPSLTVLANSYDLEYAAAQGNLLPAASAELLEAAIERNPNDIFNRARLLGFYARACCKRSALSLQMKQNRAKHILWFIENIPCCTFASNTCFLVDRQGDQTNYQTVKQAWSTAIHSDPQSIQPKISLALLLLKNEPEECSQLLTRILRENQTNPWVMGDNMNCRLATVC
jgi:hypothetical protein